MPSDSLPAAWTSPRSWGRTDGGRGGAPRGHWLAVHRPGLHLTAGGATGSGRVGAPKVARGGAVRGHSRPCRHDLSGCYINWWFRTLIKDNILYCPEMIYYITHLLKLYFFDPSSNHKQTYRQVYVHLEYPQNTIDLSHRFQL